MEDFNFKSKHLLLETDSIKFQCHEGIENELNKEQRIAADVLYWARNTSFGLKGCIKFQISPGPKGIKDKRGRWWPAPYEACDNPYAQSHKIEYDKSNNHKWVNPWSLWKHSKSLQHCQYLVKYRPYYIFGEGKISYIDRFIDMVLDQSYALAINLPENSIMGKFAKEALQGKFDIHKEY